MSEPRIFTKNYVSQDDTITVSHGDATKAYLYDRDNASQWMSSGANDDATQISIEVVFKEGSTAVDRTIDSFFLINHNLKNWDLEYWNGSAWAALANENADDGDYTFKSFGEVTTSKIRLLCDETQTADAEKAVGEMIACALQMDFGQLQDLVGMERRDRERTREITLGDGSEHRMVTLWTKNRATKYTMRATVMFTDEAGQGWGEFRAQLKAIVDARRPFLWQPESVTHPDEVFLVRQEEPWSERYVSSYKGAGIEVPLSLSEV